MNHRFYCINIIYPKKTKFDYGGYINRELFFRGSSEKDSLLQAFSVFFDVNTQKRQKKFGVNRNLPTFALQI